MSEAARGSTRSTTDGVGPREASLRNLGEKIEAFEEEREEDRKRKFRAIVWVFKRVLLFGVLVDVIGIVGRRWMGDHASGVLVAIGMALIMCALVIGSAAPMDLLDFNTLCEKIPKTSSGVWLALALLALSQVRNYPHLDAVKALVNLGAATCPWRRYLPSQWPLYTTFMALYLVLDPISWGFVFIFHHKNDWLQMQAEASYAIGAFNILAGLLSCAVWLRRQWQMKRGSNTDVTGPAMATYEAFYSYALTAGVRFLGVGATWILLPRRGFEDLVKGAIELAKGAMIFVPVATAVLLGRYRLFRVLGKHFDHDGARRRRDGAFVAELLESVPVQVGQSWWVHRESPDLRYTESYDPRRNWQEGSVKEIAQAEGDFVVEIPALDGSPARSVRLQLPSGGEVSSTEEFLERAKDGLRCVEFETMTSDLMKRVDARGDPETQARWWGLSRPVREGERVDYFLSNSWYDDADIKWKKLVEVAERFFKRHGRYPTFWLDKLCISQSSITDGLRCLPVNVMACNKLLSLCGHSYLSRLWCIWELFTLFAFMSEEAAAERVEFVFLADQEEGMKMLEGMASFHVRNSHCYDPNEEARLLQVIAAVGTAHFNGRIASMARQTRARLDRQQRKSLDLAGAVTRALSRRSNGSKASTSRSLKSSGPEEVEVSV